MSNFKITNYSIDETVEKTKYELEQNNTSGLPDGNNYSDYVYWNGDSWDVDGTQVHIGEQAGIGGQGSGSIAIGAVSGFSFQGNLCVAIGAETGGLQGDNSVCIGAYSGLVVQQQFSTAIGFASGAFGQGSGAVAVGSEAGSVQQGPGSICIGFKSGNQVFSDPFRTVNVSENAIAIGAHACGAYTGFGQSANAISIGAYAGWEDQATGGIAIGFEAGYIQQERDAIAIGVGAGYGGQGTNSIAIGKSAGTENQSANSIILNASGITLNSATGGFFAKPIRSYEDGETYNVAYNDTTCELYVNTSKTFVLDHPVDKEKYLVHACLEGPEAGVYYRGKSTIDNDTSVTIELPSYADKIATDFTVQLTAIGKCNQYFTSEVEDNKFTVHGNNGAFFWLVHGKRLDIDVEPLKKDKELRGDGPYTFLL